MTMMNKKELILNNDFVLSFGTFFEDNQELKSLITNSVEENNTKFIYMFLQIFVRTACLLFLSVQLLRLFPMKNETKSKIWAAVIAAAVSLLTSIAQIFS